MSFGYDEEGEFKSLITQIFGQESYLTRPEFEKLMSKSELSWVFDA